MEMMKKLPDAEFDIMKVVWANEPPMTTTIIMEQIGKEKGWKIQTVVALMLRLVERGFLKTEKNGKERTYYSLVNKEDYLRFETGRFMKQFHNNSFLNFVSTLYDDKTLTDKEIDELYQWAKERKG